MRLALLGDIALFGHCSTPEYFKKISDYLSSFDYVVGNLETPFSKQKKTNGAKSAYICAEPSTVAILKQLHINAVTLANNHMFDYGVEGYELTKKLLDNAGIKWFGTEGKEFWREIQGNKLSFAGFCCYTTNPLKCVPYGEYGVNAYNIEVARSFISKSNAMGYLPILAVHAGLEHVNYPSVDHICAARQLTEMGNYVYYGHHPHVIQGVEEYKGSLIAHSLGNFCFDDVYTSVSKDNPLIELTKNNRTGMVLEITIDGGKVVNWKEQVIYIGKRGDGLHLIDAPLSITDYNNGLVNCESDIDEYDAQRKAILDKRIAERKAMRDLGWFLKRLRPRYIRLVMDMKKNVKLYNENVKKHI